MAQKLYFLANDKADNSDLWVTDGTSTTAVGGVSDIGVSGTVAGGLGPVNLTVFGQEMIFGGADALDTGSSNGLWLSDGTPGGTKEVGGVSPGNNKSSPFINGNPNGLSPNGFVTFGTKAIFSGSDAAGFSGLWVTDGTVNGTLELGGTKNLGIVGGQVTNNESTLSPDNIAAFGSSVLFDGFDATGFRGLWISDGTTSGTVELGGSQNQAIFDSGVSNFEANNFVALGSYELFGAPNKAGDNALWITDGTAFGTVEIGGVNNAGIAGANDTDLGAGLANSVRLGDRIFFAGSDNDGAMGLWTTDGTATGTVEVGGLSDGGLSFQHPSLSGLHPSNLVANGAQVLFQGVDSIGNKELWASDGTSLGTYEIGDDNLRLSGEAVDGLAPSSMVALGNGETVFVGDDSSNGQNSGRSTLWVTNGTFAGTKEIGGLDNLGVANIDQTGGFTFTNTLVGGDGLAYFVGADAAGDQVLWETDGTLGGTKIVGATDGNGPNQNAGNPSPNPHLSPTDLTVGPLPPAATDFTTGGQSINLAALPNEEADLSGGNNVFDTVTGSNGTVSLTDAQASLIGGGLLVTFLGTTGNAVGLYNTKGNRDTIYGSKGAVTLNGAQARVVGSGETITFATGTTGNVLDIQTVGNPAFYVINGYVAGDTINIDGLVNNYAPALPGGALSSSFNLEINSGVVTQTNLDDSQLISQFNIANEPFTSDVEYYNAVPQFVSELFYTANHSVYFDYTGPVSVATFKTYEAALDALPVKFAIADTAANIVSSLNALNADAELGSITLKDANPVLKVTVQQALTDTLALTAITNGLLVVADTSAHLHTLTAANIATLVAEGITELTATDASVAYTFQTSPVLLSDGLTLTAPANDFVRLSLSATSGIVYDFNSADVLYRRVTTVSTGTFDDYYFNVSGVFNGVNYQSYDINFSAASVRTSINYYALGGEPNPGAVVASETFDGLGGWTIYLGGVKTKQRTENAGGAFDIRYFNAPGTVAGFAYASYDGLFTASGSFAGDVYYDGASHVIAKRLVNADATSELEVFQITGQTYSSYQNAFSAPSGGVTTELTHSQDNTDGSGLFNFLGASGLTVNEAAGTFGSVGHTTDFSFTNHAVETYNFLQGAANDRINFTSGFGNDSIKSFAAGSAVGDVINISALFNNFAAAQGAVTMSGNNTVITDAAHDKITIIGFTSALTSKELGFS